MESNDLIGVTIQEKNEFQKDDCLFPQPGCLGKSTLEAVSGNAFIRCCENPECINFAMAFAFSITNHMDLNKVLKLKKQKDRKAKLDKIYKDRTKIK